MKTYISNKEVEAGLIKSVEGNEIKIVGVKAPIIQKEAFVTEFTPSAGQYYVVEAGVPVCMDANVFEVEFSEKPEDKTKTKTKK